MRKSDIDNLVAAHTKQAYRTRMEAVAGRLSEIRFKLKRARQDRAFDARLDRLMKQQEAAR